LRSLRHILTIILLLMIFGTPGTQAQTDVLSSAGATGKWLDEPLQNWNRPPLTIPNAKADLQEITTNRCSEEVRAPHSPEDRQVARAGWALVAPAQNSGSIVVVQGMLGVDGMCRPLQYQDFVFVHGKFAGTLSPHPMDSRSDGAVNFVKLVSSGHIHVQYSRYKDSDPLCCPSRLTTIKFTLQDEKSGAVIVPGMPQTVTTSAAQLGPVEMHKGA
jgi:hypothetical protein